MEDIRSYNFDQDDTLRDHRDDAAGEREAKAEDEVPFEIPRD
jgi:hypothetical protein